MRRRSTATIEAVQDVPPAIARIARGDPSSRVRAMPGCWVNTLARRHEQAETSDHQRDRHRAQLDRADARVSQVIDGNWAARSC
jgi:hypothetical protein